MKKTLVKIGTIFDLVNKFFVWFIAILLTFGWLSVCYDVVMRSLLNRPTIWTLEINQKILVFITFLGAAWLLREGGHVRIDILVNWLPKRALTIINFMTSLLSAIACLVVVWFGVLVVWEQFQMDYRDPTVLALPQGPIYIVIPLGFFLLFVNFIRITYGYVMDWRSLKSKGNK